MAGETAHVHFVYNCPRRRPVERCVSFPIVGTWIRHHALHRRRYIVTFVSGCVATVVLWNNGTASIRVDENFGRIEAHSTRRIERTLYSIAVDLPRFHARHEDMPVVICPAGCGIDRDHTLGLSIINTIKEEEFDPG